jgi:DNA-binding CsgD family transcriptional regulator
VDHQLDIAYRLGQVQSVGQLVDQALSLLEDLLGDVVVSFNRIDIALGKASVAFRPYRPELETAVDGVGRMLAEHPLYRWYTSQPDWSAARISDAIPDDEFRQTRLFKEVLEPAGAHHTLALMFTPPATGEFIYLAATRSEPDFSDEELAACRRLQPILVAAYGALSAAPRQPRSDVALTRRERAVLGYLADGLTANAIARNLSASPATVRKHLQNLYAKLGTSDRLGAVIRGRDLGLLHPDDLAREFTWNIRNEFEPP